MRAGDPSGTVPRADFGVPSLMLPPRLRSFKPGLPWSPFFHSRLLILFLSSCLPTTAQFLYQIFHFPVLSFYSSTLLLPRNIFPIRSNQVLQTLVSFETHRSLEKIHPFFRSSPKGSSITFHFYNSFNPPPRMFVPQFEQVISRNEITRCTQSRGTGATEKHALKTLERTLTEGVCILDASA